MGIHIQTNRRTPTKTLFETHREWVRKAPQMTQHPGICVVCNKQFTSTKPSRYCSDGCRNRGRARRRKGQPESDTAPRICRQCGTEYVKTTGRSFTKYCSVECRKAAAQHGRAIACVVCGEHYDAPNYRTVSCPRCAEGYRKQRRKGATYTPTCVVCGELFTAHGAAKRCPTCGPRPPEPAVPNQKPCRGCGAPGVTHPRQYCSERCKTQTAIDRAGARIMDLYAMATARGVNGMQWRQRLIGLLTERDGPHCQICGGLINYKRRSGPRGHPSGTGPSIDHIHPRSLNGGDDLDNLRLTHWKCNRAKRATTQFGAPQLALEYTT